MNVFKPSTLSLVAAILLLPFAFGTSGVAAVPVISSDRAAVLETQMALRDLWVEHVFWIRSYVLATHSRDATQARIAETEVVANAKTLAGTIAPFYGQSAADGLLKLLAGHWGAVRDYNTATLASSKSGQEKALAVLTANAHAIGKFLSGANPYLPENVVFGLFAAHGAHHVAQITQISAGNFHDEAATWHAMRHHMLVISDAIADALSRQYPARFQKK
ncbi:MAG: hypothetical protein ABIT36_03085 [Steroidobacteraceae bacterium]